MGLSASQARLLSITARLTHNETESQLITNSKLRLSDKSAEASEDYIEALNSTQYVYSYYDSTGSKSYYDLTVGNVTQFSEIKNQYGFVDAQGRLLVSATDAANYEDSDTLEEFLYCYGVGTTTSENTSLLTQLYGSDYANYYDSDNIDEWYDMIDGTGILNDYDTSTPWNSENYTELKNNITDLYSDSSNYQMLNNAGGLFSNLVSAIASRPDYVDEVAGTELALKNYELSSNYTNKIIENIDDSPTLAIAYIEHDLADLIWSSDGLAVQYGTDNGDGTYTLTSSDGISVTSSVGDSDIALDSSDSVTVTSGDDTTALLTYLSENASDEEIQALIDLYCNVVAYLKTNKTDNYGSADVTGSTSLTAEELYADWYEQFSVDRIQFEEDMRTWIGEVQTAAEKFKEELDSYSDIEEPDDTDTKYQWYVNLWYRMGGGATDSQGYKIQNSYKILDDEYMYNADWLKFALEHGIVTMEQVQYQEEGETTAEEMNQYAWVSITYTSCADVSEESDETAIAKAEAEYEQICSEIQVKDKKYDNDLKDLDTEHDALQTEYDSIKSVIEKNVERSFKAFS